MFCDYMREGGKAHFYYDYYYFGGFFFLFVFMSAVFLGHFELITYSEGF